MSTITPAHLSTQSSPQAAAAEVARTAEPPDSSYVLLEDIRWETYEALVEDVGESHVCITYDEGRMVIMAPRQVHDRRKRLIGRMIETTSMVMRIPIASMGSATWRRKDRKKGLEPEEAYYVQNEPFARTNWDDYELPRDPAPDLAVESDNTHHPLDRKSIYAALQVNEIWLVDQERVEFLKREGDQKYRPIPTSEAFPFITPEVIERHLAMLPVVGESAMIDAFQDWLRTLPGCPR
jgi:Uma2 family endonuclease